MKFCPVLYICPICMRFSTVGVHETLLNDCEFRENRQSEELAFLTGVYDIRFTGCTCVPRNLFDS